MTGAVSARKRLAWFSENFKEVVNLAREEAQARCDFTPGRFPTPYDAMLDLYCTGDSNSFIADVFTELKKVLPGLVQEVVEKQKSESLPIFSVIIPLSSSSYLTWS